MLIGYLAREERVLELLDKDIKSLETPERDQELGATEDENAVAPELKLAVAKLRKATIFLFHLMCFVSKQWNPDKELPALSRSDLIKSIQDTGDTIQKLIDDHELTKPIKSSKIGVTHTLENGVKSLCVHVKPFLKTFLSVAAHGSSV